MRRDKKINISKQTEFNDITNNQLIDQSKFVVKYAYVEEHFAEQIVDAMPNGKLLLLIIHVHVFNKDRL